MDQQVTDIIPPPQGDARTLENALKVLWEKARRAAELIGELRVERQALRTRVDELERQYRELKLEVEKRDSQVNRMIAEHDVATPKAVALFANGEREALATKVKALLAKIEAYL